MTLNQLRYFLALSKNCHFSETADQLYISQSSLSYAISRLENELNVKLFERQGSKTTLSRYGKLYAEKIEPIFELLEEANRELEALRNPTQKLSTLGVFPSLYKEFTRELINAFCAHHPERSAELTLINEQQGPLISALESGEVGLILCTAPTAGMEYRKVFEQKLALYVPNSHPLADKTLVDVSDLQNEKFILLTKQYPSRLLAEELLRSRGIQHTVISQQNSITASLSLVANGVGIALLPHSPSCRLHGLHSIEVNDSGFQRDIYLAWMKNKPVTGISAVVRSFLVEYGERIYRESRKHDPLGADLPKD